jgi:hypothetical protein
VARLLGIRLLRLDARIVLTPAERAATAPTLDGSPSRPPARSSYGVNVAPPVARPGLAVARREIDEGAEILAGTRRATDRRT